ncbi:MAG: isoprenylcysteine carboxylmethyltransferase family protein [Candidatus Woesearchaeota archaeon]
MFKEHFGFMEGKVMDKYSLEVILLATLFTLVVPIIYYNTLNIDALIHWGSGMIIFGIIIRILGKRDIGKQFTWRVKIVNRQKFITVGIYRYMRHPIYFGFFLSWLGYTFVMRSFEGILVAVLALLPALYYRVYVEEKALIARFGEKYKRYKRKTIGLLPFIY